MKLRCLVSALALALALPAFAQQYPTKPVRLMIGYAAGSSTDIVGRVMADRLGAYWKQTVIVENRGGAAGNLAAEAVAKATGDGYTLLFAQNGLAISAAALPNLPFKAETDLVPLAPVAATPHILIVGPDFPAKNVQDLVARAKAEPGKLTFASSGVGNSDHLCGELFSLMAGIQAVHIPYKGGAPAVQDVIPGRVDYYFAGMPVGLPLAKSGRARALGVTSRQRYAGAPDIATIAEQGLPQ
jgi:tripartite-type tricarboxylate transporter receptor subunit TctC